jgi:hypothetical protein
MGVGGFDLEKRRWVGGKRCMCQIADEAGLGVPGVVWLPNRLKTRSTFNQFPFPPYTVHLVRLLAELS